MNYLKNVLYLHTTFITKTAYKMENLRPRWEIGTAVKYGDEAYALANKYKVNLGLRLKTDELPQFKIQVDELSTRRSGQTENLVTQKSKTKGQDEIIKEIREDVVSVRNLVKTNKPSQEIAKAYGIGEKINNAVTNTIAAANLVIKAFADYPEWSKEEANILEEDITEIKDELVELNSAAGIQDSSMTTRKYGTMDKNILQRIVEDETARLSAMGAHVFRKTNPAVALLFENLIPSSQEPPKTEQQN